LVLTSNRAKRDLFDLWQMSVSVPFGDTDASQFDVGNDRMASKVANEFRYNIRNIEIPDSKKVFVLTNPFLSVQGPLDTSRLSSTLTSILFPAQPPKPLVKSVSEQHVPTRHLESPVSGRKLFIHI
jgi:hypothetical protein